MMRTTTAEDFLDHCERAIEGDARLVDRHVTRLVTMGRRLCALEAALRSDPGHGVTGAVVAPTDIRTKAVADWQAMGRALLSETGPFVPDVCRVCGCTETTACSIPAGKGTQACGWVAGTGRTLCDAPACTEAALATGMIESNGRG
jgi:hypothetical protein